jgi:hypothetical protein
LGDFSRWKYLTLFLALFGMTGTFLGLLLITGDHNSVQAQEVTPTPTATPTPTPTPTPPPTNGCTPGFWKNHTSAWVGYSPDAFVSSVFLNASPYDGITLLEALSLQGGPGIDGAKQILLRAAVASLLNGFLTGGSSVSIADVNTALGSGDRDTIINLASFLDGLNNGTCTA